MKLDFSQTIQSRLLVLLMSILPAFCTEELCAEEKTDVEGQLRRLIPSATAMDTKLFEKLATSPSIKADDFDDHSLTFALFATDYKTAQESEGQFRWLTEKTPKPNLLAKEMYRSIGGGRFRIVTHPVTMIQQDRITKFEVKIAGKSATGTFAFHVPQLYEGKTDFTAEQNAGNWRITGLRMPGLKIDLKADKSDQWWNSEDLQNFDLPQCLIGHSGSIFDLDFSQNGKFVVSGGSDHQITVWNVSESIPVLKIPRAHVAKLGTGIKGWVLSVAFGSEGQRIASSSDDGTAKIWNASTGELERTIEVENIVNEVCFSPDGSLLLTSGSELELWNAKTGVLAQTIYGQSFPSIAIGSNGRHVVTAGPDSQRADSAPQGRKLKRWNANTGKLLATSKEQHRELVTDLDFSPEAKRIASCGRDQTIRIWDANDLKQIIKIESDQKGLQSLAWSPDGQWIVTSDLDGQVKIWNSTTGELYLQLPDHPGSVRCVEFRPDGKQIATAGSDGVIRLWNIEKHLSKS